MSPNEEIISIIRYAPGPIDTASIYDKCKSVENIKDVSSRLSALYNQGRLARTEIVTANNRKGFAYSIPQKTAATNDDALPVIPDLPPPPDGESEPRTPREKGQIEAAFRRAQKSTAREFATSDASLADAIIARLKTDLGPMLRPYIGESIEAETGVVGPSVHIHIDQIDIHLGGL
jgi:hypothetical protein